MATIRTPRRGVLPLSVCSRIVGFAGALAKNAVLKALAKKLAFVVEKRCVN
jgi:hypothetical protein